jgi:hypothetical protein
MTSQVIMLRILVCSFGLSLVMPYLVAVVGNLMNQALILAFWPASIVLMSLGIGDHSFGTVLYVWGVGVALNVVLYCAIGCLFGWIYLALKRSGNQ